MKKDTDAKFKFRAECAADAQAIRSVLLPWLMEWNESRDNLLYEDTLYPMPGVIVQFSLINNGLSIEEMLWLIDGIDNCHIAAETLAIDEDYTGQRVSRERFGLPARRPTKEIFVRVLSETKKRQAALNIELTRALHTYQNFDNASRHGDTWQPFHSDAPSPGWLVVLSHAQTGLQSICRIVPPIGCKSWEKRGDKITKDRTIAMAA